MRNNVKIDETKFAEDFKKYRDLILSSSRAANKAVNAIMMLAFYEIGQDIQKKGMLIEEYIKRVSNEFPKSAFIMSEQNIRNMCKLSLLVSLDDLFDYRVVEIMWEVLIPIIEKANNKDEFIAYIQDEQNKGEA